MDSKKFKRFDMSIPPRKPVGILIPVNKILMRKDIKIHKPEIEYIGTENIKGPFLLLGNHNAYLDINVCNYVLYKSKNKANFVVAIDGFLNREKLLRYSGLICKRKFTNDILLIRQISRAKALGDVVVLYPEARYSLCGTTAILPESLGKMAKMLKMPVVTLICHGHHINSPFWDTSHDRGVCPTKATYKLLYSKEELAEASVEEINEKITKEFQYDDFKYQLDNKIVVDDPKRAVGLHRVLYQCPNCKTEYKMISFDNKLKCNCCNKEWEMTEYGQLKALDGNTEFSHIPDWYEWERENVRQEILNGTYSTGVLNVRVDSLPKNHFIDIGHGTLVHDMNGFRVEVTDKDGDKHEMVKDVESMYSCHIEYQYLFKHGDCIDLNTLEDTWYIYPEGDNFAVTKVALATEELYKNKKNKSSAE